MHFKKLYFITGFFFCFLTLAPSFGMDHWFSDVELQDTNALQKLISDLEHHQKNELHDRIYVACKISRSDNSPWQFPPHPSINVHSYEENSAYAKLTCKIGELLGSNPSPERIKEAQDMLRTLLSNKSRLPN